MAKLRRSNNELRVEMIPLLDVVFLLLTFFIYSMVLMVRAELLPVQMHTFASGEPARIPPAVAVTIDRNGALFLNREPVSMDVVRERLAAFRASDANTVVYVAAEARGDEDRLPVFFDLYEQLANAGLTIKLVGSPE